MNCSDSGFQVLTSSNYTFLMNPNIFRENDIRGIVDEQLSEETVWKIARAIGTYFRRNGAKQIAVGYDARESSTKFYEILIEGLNQTGCDCILIGRVPTPVLYFTVFTKKVDGGVMITGSHNPANHNGFKVSLGKESLYGSQIQEIKEIAISGDFAAGVGKSESLEIWDDYFFQLSSRINFGKRKLKVVIDAGNGMGGVTAVPFYQGLGVEIIELFCRPDSSFPNHEPDPSQENNLQDLIREVLKNKADCGIAFDGDADRITIIDEMGRVIWGDELLILLSREVLRQYPNSTIVAEVKCTQVLFDEIEKLGGRAVMSKAGHSIIKAQMRETNAILGGEMSGHIFFADRFYGFDDACYAGARVLEILSQTDRSLAGIFADFPQTFSTPEIRVDCTEEKKTRVIDKLIREFSQTNEIITIDGVRIKFESGWGVVRPSNTQAILVLRFEADSEENLEIIRRTVEGSLKNELAKAGR